jgi:uncharacterized repeat protein (TIGR03803 family)
MTATLILASSAWGRGRNTTLYSFTGGADGNLPSGMIFDGAGNLYGTTYEGGALGYGAVFELIANSNGTWTESVLYQFLGGHDGAYPLSSPIFDGAGNLYGTTKGGGDPENYCTVGYVKGCGVIFELMPNTNGTWTERTLYQFTGLNDGAYPSGTLTFDGAGDLYGTTYGGGVFGCGVPCGVVFRLTPDRHGGWIERVIHSFKAHPGALPVAGLVSDPVGNLYGTTSSGGSAGAGIVFELTPGSNGRWVYNVLHVFRGGKDGANPLGSLVLDAAGVLYGTTDSGGAYRHGNVFKLTPTSNGGWTHHVIHQFEGGEEGSQPVAGLSRDATGNLYGTTLYGGNPSNCRGGCGVVFALRPVSSGWKESVLWRFGDHPGAHPATGLVLDAVGNLYGTSGGDRTNTFGSIFEIMP